MLIRGGTILQPSGRTVADVRIEGDRIVAVGPNLPVAAGSIVLDAGGCWVMPGLVDLHVHLRQPGGEDAETVETGSRAAALGGFTAVLAMPNTSPAQDCVEVVRAVRSFGVRAGLCDVHPAGAITVGRAGETLTDFESLYLEGVRMFTDDGNEVADAAVMRAAFTRAARLPGAVLGQHAECAALVLEGHLHEGRVSALLGLAGRPAEAEEITVARDIARARLTGGRLHILHASTARTVAHAKAAKAEGLDVTIEVTPQHLTLTEDACAGGDPLFKVNPPLRTAADVAALRQGLSAGVIDSVATDHAPHTSSSKAKGFADAPPGMLGLETALSVIFTDLVLPGLLTLEQMVTVMSCQPARIAGLASHGSAVAIKSVANLCIVDPQRSFTVDPAVTASKSRNTPFAGRTLRGKVRHTVLAGVPVVIGEVAQR